MTSQKRPKPAASGDTPLRDLKTQKQSTASDFFNPKERSQQPNNLDANDTETHSNIKQADHEPSKNTSVERAGNNARSTETQETRITDPKWNTVIRRRRKSSSPRPSDKDGKLKSIRKARETNNNGPATRSAGKTRGKKASGKKQAPKNTNSTVAKESIIDSSRMSRSIISITSTDKADNKGPTPEETSKMTETITRPAAEVSAANNPKYRTPTPSNTTNTALVPMDTTNSPSLTRNNADDIDDIDNETDETIRRLGMFQQESAKRTRTKKRKDGREIDPQNPEMQSFNDDGYATAQENDSDVAMTSIPDDNETEEANLTEDEEEEKIIHDMIKLAENTEQQVQAQRSGTRDRIGQESNDSSTAFSSIGTSFLPRTNNPRITEVQNKIYDNENNLRLKRLHVARYDLVFNVEPTDDPESSTREKLMEIFSKLQAVDKTVVVYPWVATDATGGTPKFPSLTESQKFPTLWGELKKYFPGLRAKEDGSRSYTSFWVGSNKSLTDIMESTGQWFKRNNSGMYLKQIQSEREHEVGWLLYSVESNNLEKLQKEWEKLAGFPIHARFQIINTGRNAKLAEDDKHKGIYIRVNEELAQEADDLFGEMYSSTQTKFPLNHTMRLIPPIARLANPNNKEKFEELRQRQGAFQANMVKIPAYEISRMETITKKTGGHLHEMLISIKSKNVPDTQLFHCIDKPSIRAPVYLWCHPDDESEARAIIAGMIAYFRHWLRKTFIPTAEAFGAEENRWMSRNLYCFFRPQAVKRSFTMEWSESEGSITTRAESEALNALSVDCAFHFSTTQKETEEDEVTTTMSRLADAHPLPPYQYQTTEADDVSTFRSKPKQKTKKKNKSNNETQKEDQEDVVPPTSPGNSTISSGRSKGSTNSLSTLSSSIVHMNSNIENMMEFMKNMNTRLSKVELPKTASTRPPDIGDGEVT